MNLDEFLDSYSSMSNKNKTSVFNNLSIQDRLDFLEILSDTERADFLKDIRRQAVKDFWTHERELLENGKCTRDWTPEQIEDIMNISDAT